MRRYMVSALFMLGVTGCDEAKTASGTGSAHPATLEGSARRADGDAGGAVITVLHVQADGSTEADENGGATADAEGRYSVDIGVLGEGEANLIVQAVYADGTSASALVVGTVAGGETRTAPPMDDESSAEAQLFVSLVASGELSADSDDAALLRAFVDSSVAAASEDASASERAVVASASAAATASWRASAEASGEGESAMSGYIDALIEADADADAEADSGGGYGLDAFGALESAWTSSGGSMSDLAYAMNAASEANLTVSGSTSGSAVSEASSLLLDLRAQVTASAVEGAWASYEPSSSDEAEQTDDDLLADVSAIVETSGDALNSSWDAAMGSWSADLLAQLSATLTVEQAAVYSSALTVAVSAQAELALAIDSASQQGAEATGEAIAQAYAEYRASIEASLTASLTASGAFDAAQIEALVQITALAYANPV